MAGSKADRYVHRFQDKQRQQTKAQKKGWDFAQKKADEMKEAFSVATKPPTVAAKKAWPTTAGTSNTTGQIYGTYGGTPITFSFPLGGSLYAGTNTVTFSGAVKQLTDKLPSDDFTRQMVERTVLAAIDRCLAADHYPKGIALSQAAYDSLEGSPLVKAAYWDATGRRFLDLPMHVVEMLSDMDVEVGW